MTKLIDVNADFSPDVLEDVFLVIAQSIERSLLTAGAKEGEYTRLDCYKLAQPFVLEMFKRNPEMS